MVSFSMYCENLLPDIIGKYWKRGRSTLKTAMGQLCKEYHSGMVVPEWCSIETSEVIHLISIIRAINWETMEFRRLAYKADNSFFALDNHFCT